ncbi:hypothetical protein J2766_001061 [Agrobacterium tumefaciens]|uniref:Uncharacterized protein n=1 Tax=Agrobacterium tumefaciens TaxID=358 RepID=A0AAW8LR41_AGRTU|nr:hypothetical protein [Agrobacterium tumefaciens]MBP2564502.1 hypothetical protein [Agrobacterium tumefaciens]MDR6701633.1 hypothetical protein [Agrobacterium tumefaciens]
MKRIRLAPVKRRYPHTFKKRDKKDDFRPKWELYTVLASVVLSAVSAMASAYAAYQTAAQVRYSRAALTASDANAAFKQYIQNWENLCSLIDITGDKATVLMSYREPDDKLHVLALDHGFKLEAALESRSILRISDLSNDLSSDLQDLSTWTDSRELGALRSANGEVGRFISSYNIKAGFKERKELIIKNIGYCRYLVGELKGWYGNGHLPIQLYPVEDITLKMIDISEEAMNTRSEKGGRLKE